MCGKQRKLNIHCTIKKGNVGKCGETRKLKNKIKKEM